MRGGRRRAGGAGLTRHGASARAAAAATRGCDARRQRGAAAARHEAARAAAAGRGGGAANGARPHAKRRRGPAAARGRGARWRHGARPPVRRTVRGCEQGGGAGPRHSQATRSGLRQTRARRPLQICSSLCGAVTDGGARWPLAKHGGRDVVQGPATSPPLDRKGTGRRGASAAVPRRVAPAATPRSQWRSLGLRPAELLLRWCTAATRCAVSGSGPRGAATAAQDATFDV